ncbi:hypothetical protein G7Y89_g231 [Cudoniella acicularis]|uniref:DASH complex subunit DUO1 n=1 Tax=Cudoniella acicularis TaxID=354080 RepID=A0A8H4RXJ6_9HELO|nr:hypothetical protein G7Y89_g231 [Cudoniella acicularis]
MATSDLENLHLSDSDDPENLFTSPTKSSKEPKKSTSTEIPARNGESKYDAEAARESSLKKELESVRSINEVIEGVVSSLECAKGNMDTVSRTVTSASTLLNTWIRILSQTEHNQRLILNPNWQGASQDVADMENETVLKAQAAERRAAEEERRREDARRRAEDEERQRQAGTVIRGARGTRGTRGRGRGTGRGLSSGYGINTGSSSVGRGSSQTTRSGIGLGRSSGSNTSHVPNDHPIQVS